MLEIEENTNKQSNAKIKTVERKKRLHNDFKGAKWTQKGVEKEFPAVKEYLELKREGNEKLKFENMGLDMSKKCPLLAGSPDGKLIDMN